MVLTVGDVLKEAMGLCNATEIDETPSSSEMAVALRACNIMLDRWSSQRLLLRSDQDLSFTFTIGKESYTVGPAQCDITAQKIISVQSGVVTDNNLDYDLEVITEANYESLGDKNVSTGRPIYVTYDARDAQQANPTGALVFYYTPDKAYSCRLKCQVYLTELVNYSDTLTFEPAYYEAIVYNLAVRLFRRYADDKTPIPQDIVYIANESLNNLKTLNSSPVRSRLDIPGVPSKYNIYTDGY